MIFPPFPTSDKETSLPAHVTTPTCVGFYLYSKIRRTCIEKDFPFLSLFPLARTDLRPVRLRAGHRKTGKRSFVFITRPAIFRNHQSTGGNFSFPACPESAPCLIRKAVFSPSGSTDLPYCQSGFHPGSYRKCPASSRWGHFPLYDFPAGSK